MEFRAFGSAASAFRRDLRLNGAIAYPRIVSVLPPINRRLPAIHPFQKLFQCFRVVQIAALTRPSAQCRWRAAGLSGEIEDSALGIALAFNHNDLSQAQFSMSTQKFANAGTCLENV